MQLYKQFLISILCSFLCFNVATVFAQKHYGNYVTFVAKKGDNINQLIKKYQLNKDKRTLEHFYKKNKLAKTDYLLAGKTYFLPIYSFSYNGKSIRTSLGINDYNMAVRIKDYNDFLYKSKVHKKSFTKSKVFWVLHHELKCTNNIVPQVEGSRIFPIFGKKHQHVPLEDNILKGKVFYVVAGHGGPDPGAVGHDKSHQLCEDEYAYDVSLRLARNLIAHGAKTYIIVRDPNDGIRNEQYLKADKDEYCWPNQPIFGKQVLRLRQRSLIINELYDENIALGLKDQYVITTHVDSRHTNQRIDLFFYYYPNLIAGKKIAQSIQKVVAQKYEEHQEGRGYKGTVTARNLHMLRETKPTSIYIELGNITNPKDQKRIIWTSNRQALANWLYEGIVAGVK
ncbi:MAG: N-acetylmuramoyl-L-alanine amidase family protein [Chitinophagales bacterium]